MKKIYLLLGAAMLSASMMAADFDTIQVNGIYYQLNTEAQTAAVIRHDAKFVYEQDSVIIPVSVNKDEKAYDVIAIEKAAFCKATCKHIAFAEGSKVAAIGQQAFQGAVGITELALPEGVKHLPLTAIHGVGSSANMKLHKVTLPATMDTLDVMSLQVANIDTIVCHAVMPPHCALTTGAKMVPCLPFTSNNATVQTPKSTKVIVPAGSEKYYRAEPGWDYFDCFAASATDTLRAGNLYYTIKDGNASVMPDLTGNNYATLTSVVVPATIAQTVCTITEGKAAIAQIEIPVVALGRAAFKSNKSIQAVTFAAPSNITEVQSMAMMYMEGMTGTLELPEGLKYIATSGIHSGQNGGQMPVKELILPSTLDSLSVISVVLNELETLEFRGAVAPKCQVRQTSTQLQIPWAINLTSNKFPAPSDVQIIIPDGAYDSYKAQAGIGDYFDYFKSPSTSVEETKDNATNSTQSGIYTILGTYLGTDDSDLPHGMYIINGKKVIK